MKLIKGFTENSGNKLPMCSQGSLIQYPTKKKVLKSISDNTLGVPSSSPVRACSIKSSPQRPAFDSKPESFAACHPLTLYIAFPGRNTDRYHTFQLPMI